MKWTRKRDLILGYGGILSGIFISGFFLKLAMMIDDPVMILLCVFVGCLFLIEIALSSVFLLGVYEIDRKKGES